MIITQAVFERILQKNGRARKRMAGRYLRKALSYNVREIGAEAAVSRPYNSFELELANRISRKWSAKTIRMHAKRMKDIEKAVDRSLVEIRTLLRVSGCLA